MEKKRKAKEKVDGLCSELYVRERSESCHDGEERRVEEADVFHRPKYDGITAGGYDDLLY